MAYEQREGQGSLWRTKEKKKDTSPDYTGSALFKGETVRLAGWIKTTQNGKTFLSLSLQDDEYDQRGNTESDDGPGF